MSSEKTKKKKCKTVGVVTCKENRFGCEPAFDLHHMHK